ncbi:serine hydrolase [Sphingosinicella sp. CPCC 101087]|uniref:serine hydrolase domain-containing protein n=1 Tax=Sphingosinicella sp. CPCC 101087 TaxID=2497754 RepID=UPI001980E85A|nr:serine hydrolase domain-containing protein [Sphingosinicella sp. CPCC 101087]
MSTLLVGAAPVPAPDFTALSTELERQCQSGEFSGVVLIRRRDQDLFEHECGEADILNNIANTRATRFKIYSTSKLLTALTVMRMVEQGQMQLDRSIASYVPDVPEEWSSVTLRQLLNHTSGTSDLTEQLLANFRRDHPTALRATLASITETQRQLNSVPGQTFAYNNFGFELLADAVAQASGRPFGEVVNELVFRPAGMTTANIERPNIVAGHPHMVTEAGLALGYNGEPGKLEQAINYAFVQLGAGAVRATVDDFARLDEALAAGRIVRPETWAMMLANPVKPPQGDRQPAGRTFGLGVFVTEVEGVKLIGHTGGTNGFISDFQRFPQHDAMMIVLVNRGFARTAWLREGVARALARTATP